MPARVVQIEIPVSHGILEGILQEGAPEAPYAAIVCHPHPLYGGTMHNKVVFHAAKALASLGWPVLRFNFRGVGRSSGTYGEGITEIEDVQAAMDWLNRDRLIVAGFSFGSVVGLTAGASDERAVALLGIGIPVNLPGRSLEAIERSTKPKLIVQGEKDEYGPLEALLPWFATLLEPKRLEVIPGASHFFVDRLFPMQQAIRSYFAEFEGSATSSL